jgi:hypothetical protein
MTSEQKAWLAKVAEVLSLKDQQNVARGPAAPGYTPAYQADSPVLNKTSYAGKKHADPLQDKEVDPHTGLTAQKLRPEYVGEDQQYGWRANVAPERAAGESDEAFAKRREIWEKRVASQHVLTKYETDENQRRQMEMIPGAGGQLQQRGATGAPEPILPPGGKQKSERGYVTDPRTGTFLQFTAGVEESGLQVNESNKDTGAESTVNQKLARHHTTPLAGQPVAGAGEMRFDQDGALTEVSNVSGHYRPEVGIFTQTVELLAREGVLLNTDWVGADGQPLTGTALQVYEAARAAHARAQRLAGQNLDVTRELQLIEQAKKLLQRQGAGPVNKFRDDVEVRFIDKSANKTGPQVHNEDGEEMSPKKFLTTGARYESEKVEAQALADVRDQIHRKPLTAEEIADLERQKEQSRQTLAIFQEHLAHAKAQLEAPGASEDAAEEVAYWERQVGFQLHAIADLQQQLDSERDTDRRAKLFQQQEELLKYPKRVAALKKQLESKDLSAEERVKLEKEKAELEQQLVTHERRQAEVKKDVLSELQAKTAGRAARLDANAEKRAEKLIQVRLPQTLASVRDLFQRTNLDSKTRNRLLESEATLVQALERQGPDDADLQAMLVKLEDIDKDLATMQRLLQPEAVGQPAPTAAALSTEEMEEIRSNHAAAAANYGADADTSEDSAAGYGESVRFSTEPGQGSGYGTVDDEAREADEDDGYGSADLEASASGYEEAARVAGSKPQEDNGYGGMEVNDAIDQAPAAPGQTPTSPEDPYTTPDLVPEKH